MPMAAPVVAVVMVRNRSWPAVSHIAASRACRRARWFGFEVDANVVMEGWRERVFTKRSRQHDLPTPESPIRRADLEGLVLARTRSSAELNA